MKQLSERYSLGEQIGRGGVGEVFRGWQASLERPVAIKLLRPELTRHASVVARFKREARNTCRLHHPNVVTVFDVDETDEGIHFVVMELLEGEPLSARLKREGPMPLAETLSICRQIVRGMAAGEGVGLIHRDLKPDNIFIIGENHVKILDFGLSTLPKRVDAHDEGTDTWGAGLLPPPLALSPPRPSASTEAPTPALLTTRATLAPPSRIQTSLPHGLSTTEEEVTVHDPFDSIHPSEPPERPEPQLPEEEEARLTRPGTPVGTPRYMSPEQVLGWQVDQRSDLYSFGCILYEMLAGQSPFDGPNSRAYMNQHLHELPRRLESRAPLTPPPVLALVHRLLAKSPAERFQSWSELREALRALQLQIAPARSDEDALLDALEEETAEEGGFSQDITQEIQLPAEPYRFLSPFTHASRHLFFGRDADLARFLGMWRHPDQPPILILTGASGVGKTSFLCARVIPTLEDVHTHVLRVLGGDDPIRRLDAALRRELIRSTASTPGVASNLPADLPTAQVLDRLVAAQGQPVAVVLDQLEEVFTSGDPEAASALQAALAAMVAGGGGEVRFILSLREDYLGTLLRTLHPLPTDTLTRTLPLRPLEAADLQAALEGPASPAVPVAYRPFTFEEGLTDEIISDLLADRAGEVAPRVQAVGARLWEMVRSELHPHITRQHYRTRLGGARGILARVLDEAIADLDVADQGVAKELLRALTHLPGSATSRPATGAQLTAFADHERRERVLRRLEDRWRVIQGYTDPRWPEARTYRITHEALIGRIQQYGEEGAARNRARQLFLHGLSLWLQGGRRSADLLTEHHFDEVQNNIEELVLRSEEERAFYEACLEAHNRGWLERLQADRQQQRQRLVLATIVPLLFISLGILVGQAPVEFITLRIGAMRAMIAMNLPAPDLSEAPLRGARLSGASLRGARLRGADLREAQLAGAELEGADLTDARLEDADLTGADLRGADLTGARLRNARLDRADVQKARFDPDGSWQQASFVGARYNLETRWGPQGEAPQPPPGALGPWGRAPEVSMPGALLAGLDLYQLSAPGADLSGARLSGTALIDADLSGARLVGADLTRTRLERTNLQRADLSRATLTGAEALGADLRSARLAGASLHGADLTGADLRGADLCGADLGQASLARARLEEATACDTTLWPWGRETPEGVTLRPSAEP